MNVIFYFTGTGNSLFAARKIASELGDTEVLAAADSFGADLSGYERVGFVYPIYFGGVPLVIKNFVESLSIPPNAYLFGVATYGGNAGNGLTELNALLAAKERELDYGTLLMMEGNYILFYGKMPIADFVNRRAAKRLPKLAVAIRNKEKRPCKLPKPGSMSLTERYRAQVHEVRYTVSDDCTSCGLCAGICPVRNIEVKDGKPVFGEKCEQCMACIQFCPQKAINYNGKTEKRKRYHHPDITAQDLIRK